MLTDKRIEKESKALTVLYTQSSNRKDIQNAVFLLRDSGLKIPYREVPNEIVDCVREAENLWNDILAFEYLRN